MGKCHSIHLRCLSMDRIELEEKREGEDDEQSDSIVHCFPKIRC
jgi:hypothetical protein